MDAASIKDNVMCNEPEFLQERLSEIIADVSTNESFDEEDFLKIIQKVFINEFYNFYNFLFHNILKTLNVSYHLIGQVEEGINNLFEI